MSEHPAPKEMGNMKKRDSFSVIETVIGPKFAMEQKKARRAAKAFAKADKQDQLTALRKMDEKTRPTFLGLLDTGRRTAIEAILLKETAKDAVEVPIEVESPMQVAVGA